MTSLAELADSFRAAYEDLIDISRDPHPTGGHHIDHRRAAFELADTLHDHIEMLTQFAFQKMTTAEMIKASDKIGRSAAALNLRARANVHDHRVRSSLREEFSLLSAMTMAAAASLTQAADVSPRPYGRA